MHHASPRFWRAYDALPAADRHLADACDARLRADPRHPSLHFTRVGRFWSVRVGAHHRALGIDVEEGVLWFWIGTHAEYDALVR